VPGSDCAPPRAIGCAFELNITTMKPKLETPAPPEQVD
jgi:hypothetical protein